MGKFQRFGSISGGTVMGVALSSSAVLLLDRYSRLDAFMKISSYIGLIGPEGIIILVIFGFALLIYATKDELQRLVARGTVSSADTINLPMFEWRVVKSALRWALGTATVCILASVAFVVIP